MKKLDSMKMELIQVREAIDMAEMVLGYKEDATIRQQLENLRVQEEELHNRIVEWEN